MAGSPQEKYHFLVLCRASRMPSMPPTDPPARHRPRRTDSGNAGGAAAGAAGGRAVPGRGHEEGHEVHEQQVERQRGGAGGLAARVREAHVSPYLPDIRRWHSRLKSSNSCRVRGVAGISARSASWRRACL